MPQVMSFSDRQIFLQALAVARNLSVACERGEHHDSELRRACERLNLAVDAVVGELVGNPSYLHVRDARA